MNTTANAPRRKRNRQRPQRLNKKQQISLNEFQKKYNAKVSFTSFPLAKGSEHRAVQCTLRSATGKITEWGSSFHEAFLKAQLAFHTDEWSDFRRWVHDPNKFIKPA